MRPPRALHGVWCMQGVLGRPAGWRCPSHHCLGDHPPPRTARGVRKLRKGNRAGWNRVKSFRCIEHVPPAHIYVLHFHLWLLLAMPWC